jgi:hypothetical protein
MIVAGFKYMKKCVASCAIIPKIAGQSPARAYEYSGPRQHNILRFLTFPMSTAAERARRDEAVNRAYTIQVVEGSKVCLSVGPATSTEATEGPPVGRRQDGCIRPWCYYSGSLHMADFPVSAAGYHSSELDPHTIFVLHDRRQTLPFKAFLLIVCELKCSVLSCVLIFA